MILSISDLLFSSLQGSLQCLRDVQWLPKVRSVETAKSTSTKGYNVPSEGVIITLYRQQFPLIPILLRTIRHRCVILRRFILQGETEESFSEDKKSSSKSSISSHNSCSFELEVCLLEIGSNDKRLVGIRRKRLKGDAWVYKRVCEEILALTAGDITTNPENSSESKCPI